MSDENYKMINPGDIEVRICGMDEIIIKCTYPEDGIKLKEKILLEQEILSDIRLTLQQYSRLELGENGQLFHDALTSITKRKYKQWDVKIMNPKQADAIVGTTCGMIERMEGQLEYLEEHGITKKEIETINNAINSINDINSKYVKLRGNEQ